jgi:putative acetyltransferase
MGLPERTPEPELTVAEREQGVVVRPARPSDARSFLQMWRSVVAEQRFVRTDSVQRSTRHYRRHFRRSWEDERAVLLAVHRGRVVGHLDISREESGATRHIASLGMAVAADWRRRGVGSALMAEAIRWACEAGVEKVALSVYPDNDAARALYAKFGFREEGRLSGHSKKASGYRDEIVMGLWLVPQPHSTGGG